MLVLARQLHERIVIPTIDTAIEVVSARAGSVRLGIDAPPDVTILREELVRRQDAQQGSLPASGSLALYRRLHNVLLGLSCLRQQVRTLPHPDLAGSVEQMMKEVVLLSRQISLLLPTRDESVSSGLAI